ncbi:MAG TPA: hypothetical protein VMX17_10580 [Candidatus Glassbacteria bacterium]|jgi:hypothetical protein|nr:hypothetical protein [Candidatus Glassbacteria bacterium]
MIEEDFYCTLKLKSGEEVFAKVAASEEEDRTMLIVSNPIVISEYKNRGGESGYKIEPWLKTTTEDMFIIKLDDVLTLSESYDIEMITMYQSYLRQSHKRKNNESTINRKMGYLSSVNDAKDILEKLYENS